MTELSFRFVNREGQDVSDTDAVGYLVRDYFGRDLNDILSSRAPGEVRSLLRAAYRGPDCDGIGLEWTVV
jgi:hypothetical protein